MTNLSKGTAGFGTIAKYVIGFAVYESFWLAIYSALKLHLYGLAAGQVLHADLGFWGIFLGTAIPTFLVGALALTFIGTIFTIVGGVFASMLPEGLLKKALKISAVLALVLVPTGLIVEISLAQLVHASTAELAVYFVSGVLGAVPFATVVFTFIGCVATFVLGTLFALGSKRSGS